ncbi:TPA: HNH endonuclease [Vibrio vulnificus]
MQKRKSDYTAEMIAFLAERYPKAPVRDWVDEFNQTFGTNKSIKALYGSCKRFKIKCGRNGRFPSGHQPHNKGKPFPTRGKSKETLFGGVRSNNVFNGRPVGSTRVCTKDGYLIVKVAEPSEWRFAHVLLWEKERGPIPDNHCVRFYDNSPEKLASPTIDNLFLVSRPVHMRLTQMKLCDIPMSHKDTAILIAKIEQQIKERESEG